ncbi:MAG TPA: ribosome biogenesis GTPase Der [Blastocatellia bacterium]|nr:ribosome biogenesis GTPase Der [Blastocatellia bacterium]HNG34710.1 ribosome biogenesis GTPase Der [Blastocatellia bacterium]
MEEITSEVSGNEAAENPIELAAMPVVAIIGRPNVGKSTLFNRLIGSRRSIVGDLPGITRDRIYGQAEWQNRAFRVIDTGGIVPDDEAVIPANIFKQAQAAIGEAGLLLFVVDVRDGITPLDEELARMMRTLNKPVFIVANKSDSAKISNHAAEFHQFGYDEVFAVSAEHGGGVGDLLDAVIERLPTVEAREEKRDEINVAIIGRPNVGKSSLINKLLGQERVIVSPIPGTTRDAVDSMFETKDEHGNPIKLRFVDTAGIRRKGKTNEMAEKLSVVMARKHIERADVVLMVIDAIEGVTALDANIAGYAHEAGRSLIVLVNKWDAIEKDTNTVYRQEEAIREAMKFLDYAPIITISALTGQRVIRLPELIAKANAARNLRIPTAQLNQFYAEYLEQPKGLSSAKRPLKVKYITQAGIRPPTFVLFTNSPKPLHFSYERYLINRLRETFDFFATPIRVKQKGGQRKG